MEMIFTFKVQARCRLFDKVMNNEEAESYDDRDIELHLNSKDAMMFLFKFTPATFKISNGMTVMMKFSNDPEHKLIAMIIQDLDEVNYIVMNPNQLWSEILLAYTDISVYNKIQVLNSLTEIEEE